MKRLIGLVFLFLVIIAVPSVASAAITPDDDPTILEGLKDKGFDWLKDKAKDAGQDWLFNTDQSETMHDILIKARERADGEGNDKKARCQYAVMGKASSILNDINYKWSAKTAGKLAFDTTVKMAGLASGFGGAFAEGGALNWLTEQYVDAAKGAGKDAVFDKIKKLFVDEKKPEFELYEESGKNGNCDYTLRAVWDIVHGTYRVYISGDCHCTKVGQFGLEPTALGKWWISFEGHLKLEVDAKKKTTSWTVLPVSKMDFDAQCACSTRELRTAFAEETKKATTGTSGGGGSTTPPPTPTGPPPLPPAGRKVCKECQSIQNQIDADTKQLADDQEQVQTLREQLVSGNANLESAKAKLEAVKANPKDYDISVEKVEKQVRDAQAEVDRIKSESSKLEADQVRITKELRDLAKKLEECIKAHCSDEHSSVARPPAETYAAALPRQPGCDPQPSGAFASRILAIHNAERAAVGAQPLCWNPQLANDAAIYAAEMARTRQFQHSSRTGRGIARENLLSAPIGYSTDRMMGLWVAEKRDFRPGIFPNVCNGDWSRCAHYTQMIWPTTTDIGCGMAPGGGYNWLVCRYSPGGNKDGRPVGNPNYRPERGR